MKYITTEISLKITTAFFAIQILLLSGCEDKHPRANDRSASSALISEATKLQEIEDQPKNGSESNFVLVKLPREIEIQVPRNWRLLTDEENKLIELSTEAALDISGIQVSTAGESNLLAANSMPTSTYASVRIDSTVPAELPPYEIMAITAKDIAVLESVVKKGIEKLLSNQGLQLTQFIDLQRRTISGNPALITEYRRSGPKGSVYVMQIQIFTENQTVAINLSYRESEQIVWKPVIEKIYRSITIEH